MANVGTIKIKVELEYEPDGWLPVVAVVGGQRTRIGQVQIEASVLADLETRFDRVEVVGDGCISDPA